MNFEIGLVAYSASFGILPKKIKKLQIGNPDGNFENSVWLPSCSSDFGSEVSVFDSFRADPGGNLRLGSQIDRYTNYGINLIRLCHYNFST